MLRLVFGLVRLLAAPFRFFVGLPLHDSSRESLHGTARWMSWFEKRRFLSSKHTGLVLGPRYRLSLPESHKNLLLCAPTGSGKSTRYCVPNLLLAEGSVVTTDPSGELFRLTSGHLAERGFQIQVLAPADLARSLRFNPMARFRSQTELRRLATILGQFAGEDVFWRTSATNLLFLCLAALSTVEDASLRHLGNLRLLLAHLSGAERPQDPVYRFFGRYLDERLWQEFKAFLATDAKVASSILASARVAVDLWADPDICRLTAADSVGIEQLREKPTALYLILPEPKLPYFAPLAGLFYAACFEFCLEHPEGQPVSFVLDEFASMRIDHFATIATTLRKRRCSLSVVVQALSQLTALYGPHDARSILAGGMNSKLFFGGLDLETCRQLEGVLGARTAFDTETGEVEPHARSVGKPLLSADEIRMLPKDAAILISGRERPARLHMPPYFASSHLRGLAAKPPVDLRFDYSREEVRFLSLVADATDKLPKSARFP